MQTNLIRKAVWAVVSACVAPVLMVACAPSSFNGTPTTAAQRDKASQETSRLLALVQREAYKVRNDADQLQSYASVPNLYDWQIDGDVLNEARSRVNAMDAALFRLRALSGKTSPLQKKAIDRIAPTIVDLTDTTQLAITSFDRNESHLFTSHLRAYADDMYNQAKLIGNSVEDFQHYSNARQELQQLGQELQIKASS